MLTAEDQAHLKTLSICWYVWAGFAVFGALCGGLYLIIGVIAAVVGGAENEEEAVAMGVMFGGMGLLIMLVVIPLAVLNFLAAKGLNQRRRKTLIYVMAAIACTSVPLGTVLGVFTFIVMGRPTVKGAFDEAASPNRLPAAE
jgi:hypothetical protein